MTRPAAAAEPTVPLEPPKNVTIQTDLITPFFGAYLLEANVRVSSHFSVLINTSYLGLKDHDWRARAGTLGAGLTYYFQGQAPRRWYVEAVGEVSLASFRYEPSGEVAPAVFGYNGVAVAGYRFIWDAGPVLDLAAGVVVLHFPSAHVSTPSGELASEAITNVYPAAKASVGWAF
jgi:hypothetical protein